LFGALHYHEYMKCHSDNRLELERSGLRFTDAGNIHDNRTHYEAHIFAFVQNLHAVCDSFPHVVNLLLGPLTYAGKGGKSYRLTEAGCGWNKNLISAMAQNYPLHEKMQRKLRLFMNDKSFLMLKGLVNQAKHQHLVRILNDSKALKFERVAYFPDMLAQEKTVESNVDVTDFMSRCSNKLLPKLFILYWTLQRLYEEREFTKLGDGC
jgi:hypothetical protein